MSNKSILIVEDEINLGETLHDYLGEKGFSCTHAKSLEEAYRFFQENFFSVVLMDINLPDGNGIEFAKKLRNIRQDFVLIYLSALNDPTTKYQGLEMGAEDFITKPFDLRELTLRLNKALVLHEHLKSQVESLNFGKLKIHFREYYLITANGDKVAMSQKECAILELLYSQRNQVISRDEIISRIWGENSFPSNRTVDNYIVKLRKWLETDSSTPLEIHSIRGVGYKLTLNKEPI